MKSKSFLASLALMLTAAGTLQLQAAGSNAVTRPIDDFVGTQGTYCFPDGSGGSVVFLPPVPNYIGWCEPDSLCALVDYAGLANAWLKTLGLDEGTQTDGTIIERPLPDGRAEVKVILHTKKALTQVLPNREALFFGRNATAVAVGARPALGDSFLHLTFVNPAPGVPIPDLLQLLIERFQDIRYVQFNAHASGEFRAAFGVPMAPPGGRPSYRSACL